MPRRVLEGLAHYPKTLLTVCFLVTAFPAAVPAAGVTLENDVGVRVAVTRTASGYALGEISLNGEPMEKPMSAGMIRFLDTRTGKDEWLHASRARPIEAGRAVFAGEGRLGAANLVFEVTVEVPPGLRAVRIHYGFSVDRDVDGRVAVLQYHTEYAHTWQAHMYPWAAGGKVLQRDPLSWVGIPSLFLYRDDRSLGALFGIDPHFDYLNPTTWSGDFGVYYVDGVIPAQYRVGGDGLKAGIDYHCPMQVVLTDQRDADAMVIDLVQEWIELNDYSVEPLSVRTHEEALELFIEGRRNTAMWYPGQGYRLEMGDPSSAFIYIGEQGLSAWFDYLVFERTGDPQWRTRAFEQMDFILEGQNTNEDDPDFGVVHTAFSLVDYGPVGRGFNSVDRGNNEGYKPDLNAHLARYMLLLWQRVSEKEGIDRKDWYQAATRAIDWVLRQQNLDGGLPQKVLFEPVEERLQEDWMRTGQPDRVRHRNGERSRSTTPGRALAALWHIHRVTGDEKYRRAMERLEGFTLRHAQSQFYYTGHHPDLPPFELEEASIWGVAEHWLNRYEETGDAAFLRHAVANAYLSLTWWCPRQLSWVDNPTFGASAEQQHFLQYSVYCYQNRKVESLWRLHEATGDGLFGELAERVAQSIYWTQVTEGDLMGATHERIADPWLAREGDDGAPADFNSLGTVYMSEQSLDMLLQVLERRTDGL